MWGGSDGVVGRECMWEEVMVYVGRKGVMVYGGGSDGVCEEGMKEGVGRE